MVSIYLGYDYILVLNNRTKYKHHKILKKFGQTFDLTLTNTYCQKERPSKISNCNIYKQKVKTMF